MITVAGGDSFVWGSELADSPNGAANSYSRNTFPALLAPGQYVCAAYPGNSNHDIVERLKSKLENILGTPFVIVCWTWPSRDKLYTSKRVIEAFQHYCEYHGLPYLFTCADNCLLEVLDTSKLNMDNWYMFPPAKEDWNTMSPRGFYQWAVENKYTVGPDNHPLEQAHQDAAQLIKDKFNEMVEKHLQQNHARNSISQET
jgi:hypothetical protein